MTVCIAAIATDLWKDNKEYPGIIGASDRMITAGEIIEYEPAQSKVSRIAPFVTALTAGDDAVQSEILNRTESQIARIWDDDPHFYSVNEIADVYSMNLVDYKKKTIERTILRPVDLTWEAYISRYPDGTPSWFEERMIRVFGDTDLPGTETIIAGVDETGAHLFVIDQDGHISRRDGAGFAAIGIGAWHAESQFMFEGHTPLKSFEDTLFLTYVAKRRAEVAPGVGKDTDLFAISLKGGYVELLEEHGALKKVYESLIRKTERETAKLKILIPKILKEVQEDRRIKNEKYWEEKMKKWASTKGTLGDSLIKNIGTLTSGPPEEQ